MIYLILKGCKFVNKYGCFVCSSGNKTRIYLLQSFDRIKTPSYRNNRKIIFTASFDIPYLPFGVWKTRRLDGTCCVCLRLLSGFLPAEPFFFLGCVTFLGKNLVS
jgi:hypothetical protein